MTDSDGDGGGGAGVLRLPAEHALITGEGERSAVRRYGGSPAHCARARRAEFRTIDGEPAVRRLVAVQGPPQEVGRSASPSPGSPGCRAACTPRGGCRGSSTKDFGQGTWSYAAQSVRDRDHRVGVAVHEQHGGRRAAERPGRQPPGQHHARLQPRVVARR